MQTKHRITLTLDGELVDEIDAARGLISRSRFVEHLLFGAWKKAKKGEVVRGYA